MLLRAPINQKNELEISVQIWQLGLSETSQQQDLFEMDRSNLVNSGKIVVTHSSVA